MLLKNMRHTFGYVLMQTLGSSAMFSFHFFVIMALLHTTQRTSDGCIMMRPNINVLVESIEAADVP